MNGVDASLEGVEAVFLDLDGTIYLGGALIPGALDFLERCETKASDAIFCPTTRAVPWRNTTQSWPSSAFRAARTTSSSPPTTCWHG